jgi:hypothetical protein
MGVKSRLNIASDSISELKYKPIVNIQTSAEEKKK